MTENNTLSPPGMPYAMKIIILLLGEVMAVSSVYFIKDSAIDPLLLSAGRLLTAALFLTPFYLRERKSLVRRGQSPKGVPFLLPGILLGIHFITWIEGARIIPAVNSTLIVNLSPVVTPFLLYFLAHERTGRKEIVGSVLVLGGSFILGISDFTINRAYFMGDVLCFFSMLCLSTYLVFSKRSMKGIWTYLVPLYLTGGIFCLIIYIALRGFEFPLPGGSKDIIAVVGLGIICTVGGHSITNWAMKHLRGQVVSLFQTTQILIAGVIGFLFFREVPSLRFLVACAVITAGILVTLIPGGPRKAESPLPQIH